MEMQIDTIFLIISTVISALTFITALFGFQLGKKAMFKSETLFGSEAVTRFNSIEGKLPKESLYVDDKYGGGNKTVPQLEIERFNYNPQTMGDDWEGITKTIRYYYDKNGQIMVKGWRLK